MDQIIKAREAIDALDAQIMDLLEQRFNLSKLIGEEKVMRLKTVHDDTREQTILNHAKNYVNQPSIYAVYLTIFEESKALQNEIRTPR